MTENSVESSLMDRLFIRSVLSLLPWNERPSPRISSRIWLSFYLVGYVW